MIVLSLISIIGIAITGLIVGFLSGLFGVGGGFVIVPILNIVFGISYNIVIGSSLAAISIISLLGITKHHKQSHVNTKLGLILLAGTLPGVEFGARLLVKLTNSGFINVFIDTAFLIVFVGAFSIMVFEYIRWVNENKTSCDLTDYKIGFYCFKKETGFNNSVNIFYLLACGFLIGILQGMLGVGGGFMLIPVLVNFFGLPARLVIGTCLFVIFPSSGYGAITHFFKGNINFILVALILSGSIIGTLIGSSFTAKLKGKKIRLYFIFLIALAIIMMGLKIML
ncbi:MAG: hypothetical protein A3J83_06800 [Elusimicrobia bacterium RIFOXYA2_FULL_40_6]|nr:MAG: hypothetical protein A3J83_06800 [Elusimicrobia bacterium RIFOXYA2_FULL_40_6]